MYYTIYHQFYPYDAQIHKKLLELGIECTVNGDTEHPASCSLHSILYDNQEASQKALEFLPRSSCPPDGVGVLERHHACFSEEEYCQANWLTIHAKTDRGFSANEETVMERVCFLRYGKMGNEIYAHLQQVEPVYVKKPVKWGYKKNFCTGFILHGVFCNDRAKNLIERSDLTGFQFDNVYLKKTGESLPDMFQITSPHYLPAEAFIPGDSMETEICPVCGKVSYRVIGSRHNFCINPAYFRPDVDFYRSDAVYGNVYIISQKVYQFLKKNDMCREFNFTPLKEQAVHITTETP